MIPNSGYPSQEQASRAMAQADEFVRRTREQSNQQLQAQHYTYTGGMQPGVMSYAAGAGALAYRGGAGYLGAQATMMGMGAAVAQPITRDIMMAGSGARPGLMPQGFFGLMATAYAPGWMLPHAAQSFHMESGLRREFASEELGRRWDMFGRRAMSTSADLMTFGISSHIMRRTGVEAQLFTEMSTERMLQSRLGVLRGAGGYSSATGFGVRRGYMTEGPGAAVMEELMAGAGGLQAQFGYGRKQLDLLTGEALGAIDPSRVQKAGRGGGGGMRGLGQEIRSIRDTLAQTARELQIMDTELPQFFDQLKGTMQITAEGMRGFREETRRVGLQGPFSQRQAAEMGMQFTQLGRGLYMDPTRFRGEAFGRALEVAQLRERGVIRSDTLLREGGSLDQAGMMRMLMARLQTQAQAVSSGQFNRELVLAQANPQAYGAMLGGAGFFETQGAVAGAVAADPFALMRARLNPDVRARVTMDADLAAFRGAQQRIPFLPGGRLSAIGIFGKRFNMTPEQAQPWYEEQEMRVAEAQAVAEEMGVGGIGGISDFMTTMERRSGLQLRDVGNAVRVLQSQGKFPGTMEARGEAVRGQISRMRAGGASRAISRIAGLGQQAAEGRRLANLLSGGGIPVAGGVFANDTMNMDVAFQAATMPDWNPASGSSLRGEEYVAFGNRVQEIGRPLAALMRRWSSPEDNIALLRSNMPNAGDEDLSRALLGGASSWSVRQNYGEWYTNIDDTTAGGKIAKWTLGGMYERNRYAVKDNQIVKQTQQLMMNEETYRRWEEDKVGVLVGKTGWTQTGEEVVGKMSDYGKFQAALEIEQRRGKPMTEAQIQRMLQGIGGYDELKIGATGAFRAVGEVTGKALESRADFSALLDMEGDAQSFAKLGNMRELAPVRKIIQAFTGEGNLAAGGYANVRGGVSEKALAGIVAEFGGQAEAAQSAGAFQEFVNKLGPERKEMATRLLELSMGQADKLVKSSVRGTGAGNELWVTWTGRDKAPVDTDSKKEPGK